MDYITKEQYERLKYQIEHNPKRNKKKDRKMTLTLEECNQICYKYLSHDMRKLKDVTRKVISKYKKDSDENTTTYISDFHSCHILSAFPRVLGINHFSNSSNTVCNILSFRFWDSAFLISCYRHQFCP